MKKKNLKSGLSLNKKIISQLNLPATEKMKGGISGEAYASLCPCVNPTRQCPTHPACITEPQTWVWNCGPSPVDA